MITTKETKKQRTRKKIMHEAKKLFEKYGMENVTFSQIAQESQICRTTVFNHFATSSELMLAIYEQEIEDIRQYCLDAGLEGVPLIRGLFDKLIEDTSYYPALTTQLTNHAILSDEGEKSIILIEKMVEENLPDYCAFSQNVDRRTMAILIIGCYHGLITHYHVNKLPFESEKLKTEFHKMLDALLGNSYEIK